MAPSYGDALFINKIFAVESVERGEIGGPAGYDLVRRNTGLQLPDRFGVADEEQQLFGIKLVGIQPLESGRDLESHPHRAHCLTIGDAHANSAAALSGGQSRHPTKTLLLDLPPAPPHPLQP